MRHSYREQCPPPMIIFDDDLQYEQALPGLHEGATRSRWDDEEYKSPYVVSMRPRSRRELRLKAMRRHDLLVQRDSETMVGKEGQKHHESKDEAAATILR